jgi:hypothetical protein
MRTLKSTAARLALATIFLAGTDVVQAQDEAPGTSSASGATLSQVMAGRDLPLAITAKDLNSSYRRITIAGQPDIWSVQMRAAGIDLGLYYTRGNTVAVGGQTYLVAYRPQIRIDPGMLNRHHGHGEEAPEPQRLRANTRLALSLLNLRSTDNLNDIRPFDAKQDLETPQQSTAASTRNLTRLGQNIQTYLANRGNVFPAMTERITPAMQRAFYPFVHDERQWTDPTSDELYRANVKLSRVRPDSLLNRRFVYAFYEATPGADGMRGVLFADGRVERVDAERWKRIQAVKPIIRPATKGTRTAARSASAARPVSANEIDRLSAAGVFETR